MSLTWFKKGEISKRKGISIEQEYGIERAKEIKKKIIEKRVNQIFPLIDTKIEVKIQNFLKQLGVSFFTHQYIKEIEHPYQCDILIPSMNLIIECDGDYWHANPIFYPNPNSWQQKQINEDRIRNVELIAKGFKVLRLWENEIKEINLDKFKEKLS